MVCIAEPCGSLVDIPTKGKDLKKHESRSSIVKYRLKPNFTCLGRPANLDRIPYDIHPALAALYNEAEEWHLLASDHCDVYEFNVWSPAWLDESTDMVFDGADGRKEWIKNHKNNVLNKKGNASSMTSCASQGWVCCMAFSEFDYLLICLNKDTDGYGSIHHINTHTKKESDCCTMDELLIHLANFVEEGNARSKSPMFGSFKSSSPLPRPLRLLRKAIIDAICR
mmetsp:Transcript_22552/g.27657  ORF Transcript_22552/g.27657 Transcript_22552/m.27657 type:complete len:225 (-) Transcript_22552:238-912(-)